MCWWLVMTSAELLKCYHGGRQPGQRLLVGRVGARHLTVWWGCGWSRQHRYTVCLLSAANTADNSMVYAGYISLLTISDYNFQHGKHQIIIFSDILHNWMKQIKLGCLDLSKWGIPCKCPGGAVPGGMPGMCWWWHCSPVLHSCSRHAAGQPLLKLSWLHLDH